MTFADALTRLTQDHLPEQALQTHGEARLLRMLGDAHADLATSFGVFNRTFRVPVVANNITLTIPTAPATSSNLNGNPSNIMRIERASFRGRQLAPAARESFEHDDSYLNAVPGYPRYFYWRMEQPQVISILPKAPKNGTLIVYTVQRFSRNIAKADHVWSGMYEAYHDIVVLEAAVRAFEASFEFEDAQVPQARLQRRKQELAAFIKNMDLTDFAPTPGQQGAQ